MLRYTQLKKCALCVSVCSSLSYDPEKKDCNFFLCKLRHSGNYLVTVTAAATVDHVAEALSLHASLPPPSSQFENPWSQVSGMCQLIPLQAL